MLKINGCAEIGKQVPLRMGWIHPCKFKSCHLYMENVRWYNLNPLGFIAGGDENNSNLLPSVYVYRLKLDNCKLYLGSTTNLAQRFRQHRCRSYVYSKSNIKLYSLVKKYGWENLELEVLEVLE